MHQALPLYACQQTITPSCRRTVGLRCLHKCLIHLCPWKKKKKKRRKVSLDEKHKWHTKFPWWIGPFTEINWIDAKDPRGAENCSAMDENPLRAMAPYKQPGLFVLHIRLVKMCWQPLFIPLNKSRFFFFSFLFFFSLGAKMFAN